MPVVDGSTEDAHVNGVAVAECKCQAVGMPYIVEERNSILRLQSTCEQAYSKVQFMAAFMNIQ